jgi:NAD(P) transhydrogenase subunit alpha
MLEFLILISFFVIAFVVGYIFISRIPSLLHTPLMSMTNAISAVTILGSFLIFTHKINITESLLGVAAIMAATFNLVGGFVITNRMIKMFKTSKNKDKLDDQ